ncbi:MAG: glycoside hydrolase family protein [Planctomycetota bacterium]|jgi:hypothetical protein
MWRDAISLLTMLAWSATPATADLVSHVPLPDPYVLKQGDTWYIFGTGTKPYLLQGRSLTPGAMHRKELQLDYGTWPHKPAQIWGFVVYGHGEGEFHAYGTLHLGGFRTIVGHFLPQPGATWGNNRPITRWRLNKILLGDVATKDWNVLESRFVRDEDGALYLLYSVRASQYRNVIRAQRMRDPATIDRRFEARTLLRPDGYRSEDRNDPGGLQLVEAASISRMGGKYVLLYSVGDYSRSNYKLGVAYSSVLVPPKGQFYEKVLTADRERVWGNLGRTREVVYLLQSQVRDWPNYCARHVVGPGVGNVVKVGAELWLVFHGYKPEDKRRNPDDRYVWKLPLRVKIAPDVPMKDWLRVVLPN